MPTFPGSSASKPYEDDSEEDETMPAFARSWAVVSAESGGCLSPATGCWEKCQPGNACMGEKRTAPTHPHEGPIPVFFLAATIMLYTSCAKNNQNAGYLGSAGFTASRVAGEVRCSVGRSKVFICAVWTTVWLSS